MLSSREKKQCSVGVKKIYLYICIYIYIIHYLNPTQGSQRCILHKSLPKAGRNGFFFSKKIFFSHFRKSDLLNSQTFAVFKHDTILKASFCISLFQLGQPKYIPSLPSKKFLPFILLFMLFREGGECTQATSVQLSHGRKLETMFLCARKFKSSIVTSNIQL